MYNKLVFCTKALSVRAIVVMLTQAIKGMTAVSLTIALEGPFGGSQLVFVDSDLRVYLVSYYNVLCLSI